MNCSKGDKVRVMEMNEAGNSRCIKRGVVVKVNTMGAWIWNPEGDPYPNRPEGEWFPFQSKRLYLVKT